MRYSSLLLLAIFAACGGEPPADSVYTNGKIYTVNEEQPWAEAVAIKDGRFVYVGDNSGAEEFLGGDVTATDLDGRMVIPGIVDAHTHLGQIELIQYNAYFTETKRSEFLAELEAYAKENPGEDWVLGCCWPVFEFVNGPDGPDRIELDTIFPERPVWIVSDAGHSSWLNSLALDALGLDADSPDPKFPIAMYKRDDDGRLTGWVKEGAAWQRMEEVWPTDQALHEEGMRSMLQYLSEHGVTTLYDAGNKHRNDEIYGFFADLEEAGKLPVRIDGAYRISTPDRRELAITEMKRLRKLYGGESLRFTTVKLFMDGVHENRSGAQLAPYADDPDYRSDTTLSVDELKNYLIRLHEERFDLHVHVIGDLATKRVLDAVEQARATVGDDFYPRVSVGHVQNTDPGDFPRFAELDVSANFTPWWFGVDDPDPAAPGLGPELTNDTYRARAIADAGGNVTFSSDDWTLDVLSPYLGMQVGHTRQYPREWLEPHQDPDATRLPESEQLPIDLLIKGYTLNGAYQLRKEEDLGSIETGKIADLVVLPNNLFDTPKYELHKTKPDAVIMDGIVIQGEL